MNYIEEDKRIILFFTFYSFKLKVTSQFYRVTIRHQFIFIFVAQKMVIAFLSFFFPIERNNIPKN